MVNGDAAKRQELRTLSKKHGEFANEYCSSLIKNMCEYDEDETQALDRKISNLVREQTEETVIELTGDKHLEIQMKKSVQAGNWKQFTSNLD